MIQPKLHSSRSRTSCKREMNRVQLIGPDERPIVEKIGVEEEKGAKWWRNKKWSFCGLCVDRKSFRVREHGRCYCH